MIGSAYSFEVPEIGPLLVSGPLVDSIVAALEDDFASGKLTAVGAGLYSIGIPKTVLYNTRPN